VVWEHRRRGGRRGEFYTQAGELKPRAERLPALPDFLVPNRVALREAQWKLIATAQSRYFVRAKTAPYFGDFYFIFKEANPDWFNVLDPTWAYKSGKAAHVDIVACSTSPDWSKLKRKSADAAKGVPAAIPHAPATIMTEIVERKL
jgi:hypothetical protein